jgi:predicted nucleic acid-binding protein
VVRRNGYVFDSGALIALERRSPRLLDILDDVFNGEADVVIPRTVIAQVWRGQPRQANVSRLIHASGTPGSPVVIDELTADRAKQIGLAIGQCPHPDIVDVHVALVALECGHAVLTSDDADIAKAASDLVIVHV